MSTQTEEGFTVIDTPPKRHRCPRPDEHVKFFRGRIIECDTCGRWWEARDGSWWSMDPFEKFFKRVELFFSRRMRKTEDS